MRCAAERAEVVEVARRMVSDGLVVGTSGNVSVRSGDVVAVTPTGVDYDVLTAEDVPVVDLSGQVLEGQLRPTSEMPMHLSVYRDHGTGAVVHTHSLHATAVSVLRDDVPAVHYQLADFGGSVRVAEYATYGSAELAANVTAALRGRAGCLLRNHGAVVLGEGLRQAYNRARQLEWLCQLWLTASRHGDPQLIDEDELTRVAAKLAGYGQR